MSPKDINRIFSKVEIDRADGNSCWLWTGYKDRDGYGRTRCSGVSGQCVHRASYEMLVGPIPKGLTIDHLCRVRHCMNPSHLEPVTLKENFMRSMAVRTHCCNGHEFTAENIRVKPGTSSRVCKICDRARQKAYVKRKREQRKAA